MKRLAFSFWFAASGANDGAPCWRKASTAFLMCFGSNLAATCKTGTSSTAGGGSGFANGEWFPYPADTAQVDPWGNVNPVPGWRNQWFYDGKFRPERYKVVDIKFSYALLNPAAGGGTDIVINWATPAWSLNPANQGSPPVGFDQNPFIGRAVLTREAWLPAGDPGIYQFAGRYDLRDLGVPFNPEWISIDVSGYNVRLSSRDLPGALGPSLHPRTGDVGTGRAQSGIDGLQQKAVTSASWTSILRRLRPE